MHRTPGSRPIANYAHSFPPGTPMLFVQTAAPVRWVKRTTHNDKALRVVSGSASSGGSTAFSTVMAARSIAQGNLPNVNFAASSLVVDSHTHGIGTYAAANESTHTHGIGSYAAANESTHTHGIGSYAAANESSHTHGAGSYAVGSHQHAYVVTNNDNVTAAGGPFGVNHGQFAGSVDATTPGFSGTSAAGSAHTHSLSGTSAAGAAHTHSLSGTSAAGAAHTHSLSGSSGTASVATVSGSVPSGGSGTALDFAVQYVDVIIAVKD